MNIKDYTPRLGDKIELVHDTMGGGIGFVYPFHLLEKEVLVGDGDGAEDRHKTGFFFLYAGALETGAFPREEYNTIDKETISAWDYFKKLKEQGYEKSRYFSAIDYPDTEITILEEAKKDLGLAEIDDFDKFCETYEKIKKHGKK